MQPVCIGPREVDAPIRIHHDTSFGSPDSDPDKPIREHFFAYRMRIGARLLTTPTIVSRPSVRRLIGSFVDRIAFSRDLPQ